MPRWILNRPEAHAHRSELRVARMLQALGPEWIIRWGYYYRDNRKHLREGDFLILGPRGGVLVMEVKGGDIRPFPYTGDWVNDILANGDHPLSQLYQESTAVRRELAGSGLFCQFALCLPDLTLPESAAKHCEIPREIVLCGQDLAAFERWWDRRFKPTPVDEARRDAFLKAYGAHATPAAVAHFVQHTEEMFRRLWLGNFDLIDMLEENRQWVVQGGAGSGKTWYALEKAFRFAGEGRKVLFLCYNLVLAGQLRDIVARRGAGDGLVEVLAWEVLAQTLIVEAGLAWDPPAEESGPAEVSAFYESTVPERLAQAVSRLRESGALPRWDALVVDEAQDHDTTSADGAAGGWWPTYFDLLAEGNRSPLAVFCDPSQRPRFRNGTFSCRDLMARFDGAVKVKLPRPLRYTQPVLDYLRSLRSPATEEMVAALGFSGDLPPGPPVLVRAAADPAAVRAAVEEVLRSWSDEGLCAPRDVLVIHTRRTLLETPLAGVGELAGHALCPWGQAPPEGTSRQVIRHVSANRAKGLDSLGVIVVGFAPFDRIEGDDWRIAFFMACSRARQMLAVVGVPASVPG